MENFVVSARKYRPATFASVVGQLHITSTLQNAISRNQLAHAYLFCGPRGVGKTTCARIFAKAINCLSPVDSEACNECESCRGFNESRSFNIHELDAASNNSVDDIRSLTDQVRIPPQIGKYSVYIIDEVHMLSAQAFNAFLKTLEEPPSYAVFILATTEKHKIIPTILSRCQIFDFNRIRVEDGVSYLKYIASKEGVTCDDESLNLIAAKADGGMRDALSMFDKAVSFCGKELNYKSVAQAMNVLDYDTYFSLIDLVLAGDYPSSLMLFDRVLSQGFSGQTFMGGLNAHFRDLLMCKNPQTMPLLEVTGSLLERYKAQAAACDVGLMFNAIALLTEIDGSLRTATNSRLNIELGLMKLCGLGQKKNSAIDNASNEHVGSHNTIDANVILAMIAELPPLVKCGAQADEAKVVQEVQPIQETVSKPEPSSEPTSEPTSEPSSEPTSPSPQPNIAASISISGKSIASIMGARASDVREGVAERKSEKIIDPQSQDKILAAKERFNKKLKAERPRIAMAFAEMTVAEHVVKISVPSTVLEEEILRNKVEVLTLLASVAGVRGIVELEIEVVDTITGVRPIKVEDKLQYLIDKNPLLLKLKKEINLDIE